MTHTRPQPRRTAGPSKGKRIWSAFHILRRDPALEHASDLEVLRSAERMVRACETPKRPKPKRSTRRSPWATSGAERRMSVDYAIRERGFGIFSDMDGLFDDAFEGSERRFDSAYDDYLVISAS